MNLPTSIHSSPHNDRAGDQPGTSLVLLVLFILRLGERKRTEADTMSLHREEEEREKKHHCKKKDCT